MRGKWVRNLMVFSQGAILFLVLLPLLMPTLFFHLPEPSPDFDCDDSTLLMYQRLSGLGVRAVPVVGDLEATGERYQDVTHVWLIVELGGIKLALDWGMPWLDRQHYEGYPITYQRLLDFVEQDRDGTAHLRRVTGAIPQEDSNR